MATREAPKKRSAPEGSASRRRPGVHKPDASFEPFSLSADQLPMGVALVDLDGVVVRANRALLALTGYTPDQLIGRTWTSIVQPDALSVRDLSTTQQPNDGIDYNPAQGYLRHRDGHLVQVSTRIQSVPDEQGRSLHSLCFFEEVRHSETSAAELHRIDSRITHDSLDRETVEERLRVHACLLDVVQNGVIVVNIEAEVVYWSQYAQLMYGWSAAEAVGRQIRDLDLYQFSPEHGQEILNHLAKGERWSEEFTARRRDGTTFPAYRVDSPILDEDGKLKGVVGVSFDVTELRTTAEALRQREAQMRALIDTFPFPVWGRDVQGRVTIQNAISRRSLFAITSHYSSAIRIT